MAWSSCSSQILGRLTCRWARWCITTGCTSECEWRLGLHATSGWGTCCCCMSSAPRKSSVTCALLCARRLHACTTRHCRHPLHLHTNPFQIVGLDDIYLQPQSYWTSWFEVRPALPVTMQSILVLLSSERLSDGHGPLACCMPQLSRRRPHVSLAPVHVDTALHGACPQCTLNCLLHPAAPAAPGGRLP